MSSPPPSEPQVVYQPYRPPAQPQYRALTIAQQQQLQQQQLQHQLQLQAAASAQPSTADLAKRKAKMAAFGFMMGAVVGSSVVGLHAMMNRIPLQQALKTMSGSGAAFGTIFAVGTLFRPS